MMLEGFFQNLMRQAGLEPGHIVEAYNFCMTLKGELEGFKAGVPRVIAHYNQRLDTIDRKLDHIIAALSAMPADPARPPMPAVPISSPELAPTITTKQLNGGSHE